MDTSLLREHAKRCRALADGANTTCLAETFLQLATDLESQADACERTVHPALKQVADNLVPRSPRKPDWSRAA